MVTLLLPLVFVVVSGVALFSFLDWRSRPLEHASRWVHLEDLHEDLPRSVVLQLHTVRRGRPWSTDAYAVWNGSLLRVTFPGMRLPEGAYVLVRGAAVREGEGGDGIDAPVIIRRRQVYVWTTAHAPELAKRVLERLNAV